MALVAMLLVIALMLVGLQRALVWVSFESQRAAEEELAFIGSEFTQAIRSYYLSPTGSRRELPQKLENLLLDQRRLTVQRHLRRIYVDPLTGKPQWGIVWGRLESAPFGLPDEAIRNGPPVEGIVGVFSLSPRKPIRTVLARKGDASSFEEISSLIPADISAMKHLVDKDPLHQ